MGLGFGISGLRVTGMFKNLGFRVRGLHPDPGILGRT